MVSYFDKMPNFGRNSTITMQNEKKEKNMSIFFGDPLSQFIKVI